MQVWHTPDLLGKVKGSDIEIVQIRIFFYIVNWYSLIMVRVIIKMNLGV